MMGRLAKALGRGIDRFCDVMDGFGSPPEWHVRQHEDGLWYCEWEHMDQGWVYDPPGYETPIDAAAAGRKRFEQVTPLLGGQRFGPPVVDDQQPGVFQRRQHPGQPFPAAPPQSFQDWNRDVTTKSMRGRWR